MTMITRTMDLGDWRPALRAALAAQDVDALRRVPKTDLHCHGLLSAPRETYAAILGHPVPPPPRRFAGFPAFIDYITANLLPALPEPGAVRRLIRAALDRMVTDGVVYAEMSLDLLLPEFIGLSPEEFAELVAEEGARVADQLIVAPEIGIARPLQPDEIAPRLKRWLATGVWRSVDLYDDEHHGVIRDFVPFYRMAEDNGLKLKAHAGELCGADVVRESVEQLNLHAVQHGVR